MQYSILLQLNVTANESETTINIKVPSNANMMLYLFLCNQVSFLCNISFAQEWCIWRKLIDQFLAIRNKLFMFAFDVVIPHRSSKKMKIHLLKLYNFSYSIIIKLYKKMYHPFNNLRKFVEIHGIIFLTFSPETCKFVLIIDSKSQL